MIDLIRVALNGGNIAVFLFDHRAVLELVVDQGKRAVEPFVQVGCLELGLIEPREIAKAAHDPDDALAGQPIDARYVVQHIQHLLEQSVIADFFRT